MKAIDFKQKGCESIIHDHDDLLVTKVRIYQIMTGVPSDVGAPSIRLVVASWGHVVT